MCQRSDLAIPPIGAPESRGAAVQRPQRALLPVSTGGFRMRGAGGMAPSLLQSWFLSDHDIQVRDYTRNT